MLGTRGRKLLLAAHILSSVGWMGAVAAFIVLDVATVQSSDEQVLRAAYVGMDLMTQAAIVPLAVVALATGIWISLGTKWGLFRHYWVILSLVLTVVATAVLLAKVPQISHRAEVASDPQTSLEELQHLGDMLPHSIGGAVVLLVVMVLNVYKPRGLTRYGQRQQTKDEV
jgi:hypothetical protein